MSPKPAYTALSKLLHEQWATRVRGKTNTDGKLSFRGFYGKYEVNITQNGQIVKRSFHLAKQNQNEIKIVLRNEPDIRGPEFQRD